MMPSLFVIKMVSADCSTAQESLRGRFFRDLRCCCVECKLSVQRIVRTRLAPVKLRLLHAILGARLDDFSYRFLIRVLRQHNEGQGSPGLQELGEKLGRGGILGLVFKQHQPIVAQLQHRLRFFQRAGMIQFRRQRAAIPLQDFPDQKKIFFLVSDQ